MGANARVPATRIVVLLPAAVDAKPRQIVCAYCRCELADAAPIQTIEAAHGAGHEMQHVGVPWSSYYSQAKQNLHNAIVFAYPMKICSMLQRAADKQLLCTRCKLYTPKLGPVPPAGITCDTNPDTRAVGSAT
jgi:hypothetical protein